MLFFKKKLERSFRARVKEGKKKISSLSRTEFEAELQEYKDKIELEKGDLLALFLGALMAFWPILVVFLLLIGWMLIYW